MHAVANLNIAIESISDLSQSASDKIRLTVSRFVYQLLLQPIYAEFCQMHPEIQLEISISDATIDLIQEGFDACIRFGDKVKEGMIARQLTPSLKEAFFAAPDYIAQYGLPKTPNDLQQHKRIQYRFIGSGKLADFQLQLQHQHHNISRQMPVTMIVNDTDLIIDAALKGIGIGRILEPVVRQHIDSGRLIPILPDCWPTFAGLYLYFYKNAQQARRMRVFIDWLLGAVPVS